MSAAPGPAALLGARDIAAALGLPAPTPEQTAVIEAPLEPVLVVAGAGSGKTETMTSRVVWLVANRLVAPEQVLGLTFTRKAAGELADRVRRRLARLAGSGLWAPAQDADGTTPVGSVPTISTYHAYAGRLVSEHGLRLGVEPDARLLGEAAAWQLASDVVARYGGPLDEVARRAGRDVPAHATLVDAVLSLSGELAEHLRTVDDLDAHLGDLAATLEGLPFALDPAVRQTKTAHRRVTELEATLRLRQGVLPLLRDYAQAKRDREVLDFADQMALAARLARESPDVARLERQRYRVVLLDEFQDTSEAQLVLLSGLFAHGEDAAPVMAVGDPHQSIYGWRGASATTLTRFPHEFSWEGSPAQVLSLSTSWRNDEVVLAAANVVAGPLRAASPIPVPGLAARPGAGPGTIEVLRAGTAEEEAREVAAWLRTARLEGCAPGEVRSAAVLCRKRSQFDAVVDALERAGLPVEVVGLGGLLRAPEVLDLVALLTVVDDPSRGDRLMRLLAGPAVRLGPRDLAALAAWSQVLRRRAAAAARTAAAGGGRVHEPGTGSAGAAASPPTPTNPVHPVHPVHPVDPVDPVDPASPADPPLADVEPDPIGIVEALDELPPVGWVGDDGRSLSETARERLVGLREVVVQARALTGLGLPELVLEARRLLGVDVECLARAGARGIRHLDRFVDVAAEFAAGSQSPSLGAFLAWLDAADERERGLSPAAQEPDPTAVTVLTVHAAKGLEWDVVAVPGLVEQTFPAYQHTRVRPDGEGGWEVGAPTDAGWTTGLDSLPYDLRGDRDGLPRLPWDDAPDRVTLDAAVERFRRAGGEHALVEERRLAYVALTRARSRLLLAAHVWSTGSAPRVPSRFLDEVLDALRPDPRLRVLRWDDAPSSLEPTTNPRDGAATAVSWPLPADPTGGAALAADVVERYRRAGRPPGGPLVDEAVRLLAERDRLARPDRVVELPPHVSTSALVQLATDPERFAVDLRRPMPTPPARSARRGTAFHAWVESYYGSPAMLDLDELPGSADEGAVDEADLAAMQERFLASEWAARAPLEVERAVETVVDGIAVRGRIDAVFARSDGGVTIVDWKTGAEPTGAAARARAVQLSAYRLAYARLTGRPLDDVDACFFYAATGRTVQAPLLGPDELRAVLPPA